MNDIFRPARNWGRFNWLLSILTGIRDFVISSFLITMYVITGNISWISND